MFQFTAEYLTRLTDALRNIGVRFETGLSRTEVDTIQRLHGFEFPPDLRSLLEFALPVGEQFPEWRQPEAPRLSDRLRWPFEGICFDIEHNSFWLEDWGTRPDEQQGALATARKAMSRAPTLIPVYSHRFLPSQPCEAGNPVLSVHQTDVIYYGDDLSSYFAAEFGVTNPFATPRSPRRIPFWESLVG